MNRIPEAKHALEDALALSPNNAQYLCELAHIYQTEKNWSKSEELFRLAEDSVAFSPEEERKIELSRARRGLGYVLTELGQLDKAEEKYRQCIDADPNDNRAKQELEYIRRLRIKKSN